METNDGLSIFSLMMINNIKVKGVNRKECSTKKQKITDWNKCLFLTYSKTNNSCLLLLTNFLGMSHFIPKPSYVCSNSGNLADYFAIISLLGKSKDMIKGIMGSPFQGAKYEKFLSQHCIDNREILNV